MKNEYIGEYRLLAPLSNRNAGFSKWGFAECNGQEYFIKELLNPVYPLDNGTYSDVMKQKIRKKCHEYEADQVRMYTILNAVSDGNLVRVEDFFRFGSRYYIVTERINTDGMDMENLCQREYCERVQVCLSLCHTLMVLHQAGLVHGDIKPSNILFTKAQRGCVAAKLIDVDTCFFENRPPEDMVGDLVYCAPERIQVTQGKATNAMIGCKIDVFSLGLLIHKILAGELPSFSTDYTYAFEACMDNYQLTVSSKLPMPLQDLIHSMIMAEPTERCSSQEAFQKLRCIFLSGASIAEEPAEDEKKLDSKPRPIVSENDTVRNPEPSEFPSGLRMGHGFQKRAEKETAPDKRPANASLRSAGDL